MKDLDVPLLKDDRLLELQELEREKLETAKGILSQQILLNQNEAFDGTAGVSVNNRNLGFVPAFYDINTGRYELSRFEDGREAPIHILDGIPAEWVLEQDEQGHILKTKPGIIAGFVLQGLFFTREQVAALLG